MNDGKNAQDMAYEVFPLGVDMWFGKDRSDLGKWQALIDANGYDAVKSECVKHKGRVFASDVMERITSETSADSRSPESSPEAPWYIALAAVDKELADDVRLCLRYCEAHGVRPGTFENIVFYLNTGYPADRLSNVVRSNGYGEDGCMAGTKAGRSRIYQSSVDLNNDERKYRKECYHRAEERSKGRPGPNCPW